MNHLLIPFLKRDYANAASLKKFRGELNFKLDSVDTTALND
jgi:hypothetical protein